MPKSYRLIDYTVRPGKAVERKMFLDVFKRMHPFAQSDRMRYIGMGSAYFSDFILYHRHLGINDMVSIEMERSDEKRFEFNKPFSCIKIEYDSTNEVLPRLDWKKRSIIWLDYDGELDHSVFDDINTICTKSVSGSFFLITVRAQPWENRNVEEESPDQSEGSEKIPLPEYRFNKFVGNVGKNRIPVGVDGSQLNRAGLCKVYQTIIDNEIRSAILKRNRVLNSQNKLNFEQVINITYSDGAKMLTIGGILFNEKERPNLEACEFDALKFYRNGPEPFDIKIPKLTFKEIKLLDSLLPSEINSDGRMKNSSNNLPNLAISDIANYANIYRYFPTFAEAII